ncbi:hypothetical protein Tco_1367267 [Tanacetum coccineum]
MSSHTSCPAKPLDTLAKIISSTLLFPPSCIKAMLAIPHLSQVSSMAEIDSKEAQMKLKAGICFKIPSHNKHTWFLLSQKKHKLQVQEMKTSAIYKSLFQHAASHVIDDEETLILEEASRSKMLVKQNDPVSKEKKVNTTPINYLQTSHPNTDQSASLPVKIEAPQELPKITPDAITKGKWGFEHTKAIFLKEIIPFLKTLTDIFNVFDKDLFNFVTQVQTVFNQMEAAVQHSFVDK